MKQILIGGSVTFNNVATPDLLANGGIGVFATDPDTMLLEKYASSDNYTRFLISQGTSLGYSILSEQIDKAGITGLRKMLYKAPVRPKIRLSVSYSNGVNSTYGYYTNDEFQIRYDVRGGYGFGGTERQSKVYSVVGVQANAAALYTALAAAINADSYSDVTATAASTYVELVPNVDGQTIDGAVEYYPDGSATSIVYSFSKAFPNRYDIGSGSYAQVLQMEKEFRIWGGSSEVTDRFTPLPSTYADASTTYDMLFIDYVNIGRKADDALGKGFDQSRTLVVACPASHASFAALVTAIENITGLTTIITPNTTTTSTTTAGA